MPQIQLLMLTLCTLYMCVLLLLLLLLLLLFSAPGISNYSVGGYFTGWRYVLALIMTSNQNPNQAIDKPH